MLNTVEQVLEQRHGCTWSPRRRSTVCLIVGRLEVLDDVEPSSVEVGPEGLESYLDVITSVASIVDNDIERTMAVGQFCEEGGIAVVSLNDVVRRSGGRCFSYMSTPMISALGKKERHIRNEEPPLFVSCPPTAISTRVRTSPRLRLKCCWY
jgi:hypothetical protein